MPPGRPSPAAEAGQARAQDGRCSTRRVQLAAHPGTCHIPHLRSSSPKPAASQMAAASQWPRPPRSAAVWHPSGRSPCGDGAEELGDAPDAFPETTTLAPWVTLPHAWTGGPTALTVLTVCRGCPRGRSGAGGHGTGVRAAGSPPGLSRCGRNHSVPQFPLLSCTPPVKHLPPPASLVRMLCKALCQGFFFFKKRKLNISFLFIYMCRKMLLWSTSRRTGWGLRTLALSRGPCSSLSSGEARSSKSVPASWGKGMNFEAGFFFQCKGVRWWRGSLAGVAVSRGSLLGAEPSTGFPSCVHPAPAWAPSRSRVKAQAGAGEVAMATPCHLPRGLGSHIPGSAAPPLAAEP